jgi:hypothetical protein
MSIPQQIYRSDTTAIPGSLANGQFSYSGNGDILYIGMRNIIIPIGGARTPGVLTANQALVANSTLGIDKFLVANLTATQLWANGALGTGGQVVTSNSTGGLYFAAPTSGVSGANTQLQYNNSGALAGDAGLTFVNTTKTLSTNNIIANSITLGTIVVNTTQFTLPGTTGLLSNGSFGTAGQTLQSNATTTFWGTSVNTVTPGNGLSGGGSAAAVTVNVVAGSGLVSNSTGVFVATNQSLNDLTLSGNLVVLGSTVSLNVATLAITDSMISLAKEQSNTATNTDALDSGFYASYGNTSIKSFAGLFRDHLDGVFKLFSGNIPEPTNTVATGNVNYSVATLLAYLKSGGLTSNTTAVTLLANSTLAVNITANTLSLTTPLPAGSGGTGLGTFAVGDVLVGNSTGGLNKLPVGTTGFVLQSTGTTVTFAAVDGGTY